MAFDARVLRVLVGSPSDTSDHRRAVRDAIVEWNDLNGEPHGIVLLPVMWEMSSSPDLGGAPQDILNRQIVDDADLLVAIFWTRLGTPTTDEASGTVEEIQRMRDRGARVLVYFSNQPAALGTLDTQQLEAVRAYKESLRESGLYAEFGSTDELIISVNRHLTRAVRDLHDGADTSDVTPEQPAALREMLNPLSAYRAEFRGLVARFRAEWDGMKDDGTAVDVLRSRMGELARGLSAFLGAIAELSDEATSSELYNLILMQMQKASQLSRFRIYMDGGESWREFLGRSAEVLDSLSAIASREWSL
jgi:hypothetical protein